MRRRSVLWLVCGLAGLPGIDVAMGEWPVAGAVEMVIWEQQNWEAGGGYGRLTLWRDGRSEIEVVPGDAVTASAHDLPAKTGWTKLGEGRGVSFVRRDVYPPEIASAKLQQALDAGIRQLETFRPDYLDGGGTRVVVQVGGEQRETIVPYFSDQAKQTANYRRFSAISDILGGFDTDAFEIRR